MSKLSDFLDYKKDILDSVRPFKKDIINTIVEDPKAQNLFVISGDEKIFTAILVAKAQGKDKLLRQLEEIKTLEILQKAGFLFKYDSFTNTVLIYF